ncbi:GMC oxidoreductase [Phanerochaete sordida]|uniref:GMC oxidoreductase n=1 Tax=Phanerochaete sordida TaxID=48140 RepID=A0A9P3G7Q5_9APHY|nr:GMC oxidoreductase [Phanerochaete sordida]
MPSIVTATPPADAHFDFVIVGGGTAGLALGARLSAHPHLSVLTIEAGHDDRGSSLTQSAFTYGQTRGTPLNWNWETAEGRKMNGGRTLGGSSAINGVVWTRGQDAQYDSWNELLAPEERGVGWGWGGERGLLHYMKKSETFHEPTPEQRAELNATHTPAAHGSKGPVHASFPSSAHLASRASRAGIKQEAFIQACKTAPGFELFAGEDVNAGRPTGVFVTPLSLDPTRDDSRSTAAEAYLTPVEHTRSNWTVLVGYTATKVLFADAESSTGLRRAISVRIAPSPPYASSVSAPTPAASPEHEFVVHAAREVILSAGAIHSPALLQLSGVGPPELLKSLGIPLEVALEGVGRNLQDQAGVPVLANTDVVDTSPRIQNALAFPDAEALFAFGGTNGEVPDAESVLAVGNAGAEEQGARTATAMPTGDGVVSAEAWRAIAAVQMKNMFHDKAPLAELFFLLAGPSALGMLTWGLLPLSRGHIFITSTNPFSPPAIHGAYFTHPFDMAVAIASARAARRLLRTAPLRGLVREETRPGAAVPDPDGDGGSDADWETWIREVYVAGDHMVGSAAMMRRELGGVVDARLRVYGTENVRVVDASIVPLQVSAHLCATVYGVAEKAADLILEDFGVVAPSQ